MTYDIRSTPTSLPFVPTVFGLTLDLRSGLYKSPSVPPPRRRHPAPDMVVHTPSKLEVLRQTAAERRAAAADDVPASVRAAAPAAPAQALPADHPEANEFDIWNGDTPPGLEIQAEIHPALGDHSNITTRRTVQRDILTDGAVATGATAAEGLGDIPAATSASTTPDADKISAADSVSDVTPPPPNPPPHDLPGLNPFTPAWFAQVIGAATSAAATAAVASFAQRPLQPTPNPNSTVPRRLTDRKVPDFWEDRPEYWFRIFDAHLAHFNPPERQCFDTLLPLLTPAARAVIHSLIRAPVQQPYTKARYALLRHFG